MDSLGWGGQGEDIDIYFLVVSSLIRLTWPAPGGDIWMQVSRRSRMDERERVDNSRAANMENHSLKILIKDSSINTLLGPGTV